MVCKNYWYWIRFVDVINNGNNGSRHSALTDLWFDSRKYSASSVQSNPMSSDGRRYAHISVENAVLKGFKA